MKQNLILNVFKVSEDEQPASKKQKIVSLPTISQIPVIVDDITKLDMPPTKVWVQFGRKVLIKIS